MLAPNSALPRRFRAIDSQGVCHSCRGFTLIELLAVICILGILASALAVSVRSGYKQARQARCKSNLRQFGVALTIYRGEHDNCTPDWLSNLFPDYVDDRSMYICHADIAKGFGVTRPRDLLEVIRDTSNIIDGTNFRDNEQNGDQSRNNGLGVAGPIKGCSYFYEFSAAKVGWGADIQGYTPPPGQTMADFKRAQMTYGDKNNMINGIQTPYSASRIPIARCYHHWRDQRVYGRGGAGQAISRQPITLNVAYAGNVFVGPPWWEGTLHPGEKRN